jgi:cell filamentation protein
MLDAFKKKEAEWHHLRAQALRQGEPEAVEKIAVVPGWGLNRLKAIHAHLFGDVYDWAGTTRAEPFIDSMSGKQVKTNFGIRKTGMKKAFAAPGEIAQRMSDLESWIGDASSLREMKRIDLAVILADVLNAVNRTHPFREGNGRTQRAFVRSMANASGRDIDFGAITARRMTQASETGMNGNPDVMRRLVRDAMSIERTRKLNEVRESYVDSGIDWNNLYVGFNEPERDHQGNLIVARWGSPGYFKVRATTGEVNSLSVIIGRTRDLDVSPNEDAYGRLVTFRPRGKPTPRPLRSGADIGR